MISSLITFIQEAILPLGARGVFLGTALEQVFFIIPSSFVQLGSGFIFLSNEEFLSGTFLYHLFITVGLSATLGVIISAVIFYSIAYYLGEIFVSKYGKWVGLKKEDVLKVHNRFEKSKGHNLIFFFLRILPIVPSVALDVFSGFIKFKFKDYVWLTFLGTYVRVIALALIGWQTGEFYYRHSVFIENIESVVLIVVFLVVIGWIFYRKRHILQKDKDLVK